MDACYNAAMERYAEESAKNPKWKKIYDNFSAFQREQLLWFRVTENTYDNYLATARPTGSTAAKAPAKK
jgi:TRAP-type mannitol/chloroaromatic compound transport system substrate-binding protein